jgi:hypothetical protein
MKKTVILHHNTMTSHCTSDTVDNHKEQLGSAPTSTIQSRTSTPSDYHLFGKLTDHDRPAL